MVKTKLPSFMLLFLALSIALLVLLQYYVAWRSSGIMVLQSSHQTVAQSTAASGGGATAATSFDFHRDRNKNKLYYVGQFGLGHRLSKLSAAHHLALRLNLSQIELHWGSCQTGEQDIFAFLFGTHQLPLELTGGGGGGGRTNMTRRSPSTTTRGGLMEKTILVRNDVAGYYAGQNYKNAQRPISQDIVKNLWRPKLRADQHLFQDLLQRFLDRYPAVRDFTKDWKDYTVVGLHLRAGNGEGQHFQQAGRAVTVDMDDFVEDLCQLLGKMVLSSDHRTLHNKPPILFVATDTPRIVSRLQRQQRHDNDDNNNNNNNNNNTTNSCSTHFVDIRVWPQPRVEPRQGVSYQAWKQGESCFQGWLDSMTDMALLASSDVLVAGMRSTFTQILPRALVKGPYCEVAATGRSMTCWENSSSSGKEQWLLRRQPNDESTPTASTTWSLDASDRHNPVVHKVLVHLPDWEVSPWMIQATEFLRNTDGKKDETTFVYGQRIDPKFRGKGHQFREEWMWDG